MRYRDECKPLVSSVDTVYTTYYTTFAWRSLTTETIFPLVFYVEKFHLFWYTLPLAISQTKSACVIERISWCALTRTYMTCTNTNYVDVSLVMLLWRFLAQ